MTIIKKIKDHVRPFYRAMCDLLTIVRNKREMHLFNKEYDSTIKNNIFYLGITEHSNLGDMAQCYCILRWLKTYYSDYKLYSFKATVVVDAHSGFIDKIASIIHKDDIIVFQSGYTTQDLGGVHEQMHRIIADKLPDANIIMMPQTIYFREEKNKLRTAKSYNQCRNMLFLARDNVSYNLAKDMFPDVKVMAYPDIVTSLIGTYKFDNKRDGIYICRRNDGEKYYKESEIIELKEKLETMATVDIGDTQCAENYNVILNNLKYYIEKEIEKYSYYKVTITDRYHGTIFSLAAGTPVVILQTTDHKVTTGADWFKGVYDGYVQVASSLEDAYDKVKDIINGNYSHDLLPYFEDKYYGQALRKLCDNYFKEEK